MALREIALIYAGNVHIVFPVHLNPNVQEPAYRILGIVSSVTLTDPLDYLPLVYLLKRVTLVLTDSCGIQEEAPGLGKPVLVLREVTERSEAVESLTVRVVGTDRKCIVDWVQRLLDESFAYNIMVNAVNPYGDGYVSHRICKVLFDIQVSGQD